MGTFISDSLRVAPATVSPRPARCCHPGLALGFGAHPRSRLSPGTMGLLNHGSSLPGHRGGCCPCLHPCFFPGAWGGPGVLRGGSLEGDSLRFPRQPDDGDIPHRPSVRPSIQRMGPSSVASGWGRPVGSWGGGGRSQLQPPQPPSMQTPPRSHNCGKRAQNIRCPPGCWVRAAARAGPCQPPPNPCQPPHPLPAPASPCQPLSTPANPPQPLPAPGSCCNAAISSREVQREPFPLTDPQLGADFPASGGCRAVILEQGQAYIFRAGLAFGSPSPRTAWRGRRGQRGQCPAGVAGPHLSPPLPTSPQPLGPFEGFSLHNPGCRRVPGQQAFKLLG